jgi:hypothetical protein
MSTSITHHTFLRVAPEHVLATSRSSCNQSHHLVERVLLLNWRRRSEAAVGSRDALLQRRHGSSTHSLRKGAFGGSPSSIHATTTTSPFSQKKWVLTFLPSERQIKRTYTGKTAGRNDDMIIALQLAIAGARVFYESERYRPFRI